jgi:heme-degrading monooxygenase HmoA
MNGSTHPQILFIVRFKSSLSPEELQRRYRDRLPAFRALPGLIQKYYLHDPATDEWGGLYLWDSQESLDEYLASDLRKSIPETYEIVGAPRVEAVHVIEPLRP